MITKLIKRKTLEYVAFLLFLVLYGIIMLYHEPWFDEAQSWQIAKCASVREMLVEIPHYEGHPPFWWLILAVPAKAGVPFEIGLKIVGGILIIACVWLILFKMPYPRPMRLVLPFTYFVFYQYGVIVRPYSILLLACLLLGLTFPTRNEKPYRFVLLLMLLCLSSAYGIVIAGGIAMCMVYEIIKEKGISCFFLDLFHDKRTFALVLLLFFALVLIAEMMPRENTWITSANRSNSFLLCMICSLFTFLGECTITTSSWFTIDRVLLQNVSISITQLAIHCFIGFLLWTLVIGASSKRSLKYLIIPYVMLSLFSSAVFFSTHHIGTFSALMLFWLGLLFQDDNRFEIGRIVVEKIAQTEKDKKLLEITAKVICLACFIIPIYWTARASLYDICLEYGFGRTASQFIREHGLENSLILSYWQEGDTDHPSASGDEKGIKANTYALANPVLLSAYFDKNMCYNLNKGNNSEAYMHYKLASDRENAEAIESWRKTGIPELLLGRPNLEAVYGDDITYDDYSLVLMLKTSFIWKDHITTHKIPVYVRNDLINKYQLEEITDLSYLYWTEGFSVTDEMREAFENGVPVEEILKPYLDAMFGPED